MNSPLHRCPSFITSLKHFVCAPLPLFCRATKYAFLFVILFSYLFSFSASYHDLPSSSSLFIMFAEASHCQATQWFDNGCNSCKPRYYCPDGELMFPCPVGTHQPYFDKQYCIACNAGQTSDYGSSSCFDCRAGQYCPGCANPSDPASCLRPGVQPVQCPPGHYCVSGQSSPAACPAGKYRDSPGATAETDCVSCPAGTLCPNAATTEPTICPAGSYCPNFSTEHKCDAGTYNPNQKQTSSSACRSCDEGHYCPTTGSTSETPCPVGMWQPNIRGTGCGACHPGNYCPATGTFNPPQCSAGYYCPEGSKTPTPCPAGTWNPQPGSFSITFCAKCPRGSASNTPARTTACRLCERGFYQSEEGAETCIPCPKYSTSPFVGATSVSECRTHTPTFSDIPTRTESALASDSISLEPTISETTGELTQSLSSSASLEPTMSQTTGELTRSLSSSASLIPTISSSNSAPLSASPTTTDPITASSSLSTSISESQSTSLTETVFCMNLDERTCSSLPTQCKFCPVFDLCLQHTDTTGSDPCRCPTLPEEICTLPQIQSSCHFCSQHQVCVNSSTTSKSCDCFEMTEYACTTTNSTCKWCGNEKVCVPSPQKCGCVNFSPELNVYNSSHEKRSSICRHSPSDICTFCPQEDTCIESNGTCACHNMTRDACDASSLSPAFGSCRFCSEIDVCAPKTINCTCMALPQEEICSTAGECHWCPNYQTCAPTKDWTTCDCFELRNSNNCGNFTNDHCQWCPHEDTCADFSYNCTCELFNQSVCSTSRCNWCNDMQMCTVEENTECDCYYLREERFCSTTSNNKCSWCPSSQPESVSGSHAFDVIPSFNYCIDRSKSDRCECSYLSPTFCNFSVSSPEMSSSTTPRFSSSCKYCPELELCTSPQNSDCLCGSEFSAHGCAASPVCNWQKPITTIADGQKPYCSLASPGCDPVACEGILADTPSGIKSCKASGCEYDDSRGVCQSGPCFTFFIDDFYPQAYVLYFIGLFKDALVVLLIGALGDYVARPILSVVMKVKSRIKGWKNIKHQINDRASTLYMSDKFCRENYPFSFSQYVEQICEDSFEFLDDDGEVQIIHEEFRLQLFDITAFCLFDNLLWIEPDLDIDGKNLLNSNNKNKNRNNSNNNAANNNLLLNVMNENDEDDDDALLVVLPEIEGEEQEMKSVANAAQHEVMNDNENDDNNKQTKTKTATTTSSSSSPTKRENVQFTMSPRNSAAVNYFNQESQSSSSPNFSELEAALLASSDNRENDEQPDEDHVPHHHHHLDLSEVEDDTSSPHQRDRNNHADEGEDDDDLLFASSPDTSETAQNNTNNNNNQPRSAPPLTKLGLKEKDFNSLVHLKDKVQSALVERSTSFIYYSQSRSHVVSACAAINSFPNPIQLVFYVIMLIVVYGFTFKSIYEEENTRKMFATCDHHHHDRHSNFNNMSTTTTTTIPATTSTVDSNSSSFSNTGDDHRDATPSEYAFGVFLLICFRVMNSSFQTTAALVFVKTARGIFQKISSRLHSLTLQQRIPLMGLYSDRIVHFMLGFYFLLVLPCLLAGPVFGIVFKHWRCLFPVAGGIFVLVANWSIFYISRWCVRSARLARDRAKLQKLADEREERWLRGSSSSSPTMSNSMSPRDSLDGGDGEEKDDDEDDDELDDAILRVINSAWRDGAMSVRSLHKGLAKTLRAEAIQKYTGVSTGEEGEEGEAKKKKRRRKKKKKGDEDDDDEETQAERELLDEKVASQVSISSSAPVRLPKALLVFLLSEEIPILAVSLALQVSLNYLCLLRYSFAFGIGADHDLVFQRDYEARKMSCFIETLKRDTIGHMAEHPDGVMAALSPFLPWM